MRFLLFLTLVFSIYTFSQIQSLRLHNKNAEIKDIPKYKTYYTTQFLDHFNSRDDRTFQQRFLLNGKRSIFNFNLIKLKLKFCFYKDDSFDPENGPVFFYAGNEGDIESFWNNTGFMFDIAPMFQALVVFPEHVNRSFKGKVLLKSRF
jgi:hypothetical protein